MVVDGVKQAPARAMLHAVGFSDADFAKPQVGIASTWSNLTPCNMHIDELARLAAAGVEAAGAKAVTFSTITVSDGISMGTPGHALFAGVARGDRRFDRDGGRRAGLRRRGGHRRLRQEHAGLLDGAGAARPPRGLRLRRHHPARGRQARHRVGVRGGRRLCQGHGLGAAAQVRRAHGDSRARARAPACTRRTPWHRPSRRWA